MKEISVFSINASMIFGTEDKKKFLEICDATIEKLFKHEFISKYELYLFAIIEIEDPNSKIAHYRKVWKNIQRKWNIDKFILGPEIEMNLAHKKYYASIAQFNLENFGTALEIISTNPQNFVILASLKDNALYDDTIRFFFNKAFNIENNHASEIDYMNLAVSLTKYGDIIFRWGDSSEEAELALLFKGNLNKQFYEAIM